MKKCEMRIGGPLSVLVGARSRAAARRGGVALLRRHLRTRPHAHQAVDDHAVVRVEARRRRAARRPPAPASRISARATLSSSTTSTNLRTCSVPMATSGTSRASAGGADGDLDAPEHAGREGAVGIGELGAAADRARRCGRWRCRRSRCGPRARSPARRCSLSFTGTFDRRGWPGRPVLCSAQVAQVGGLVHRELEADRIDRLDGRQQGRGARRAAGHEVADRHAPVADAARHRRAQLGEVEVELGLAQRRLLGGNVGLRDALACVRWSIPAR